MSLPEPLNHSTLATDPADGRSVWWLWLLDWFLRVAVVGLIFYVFDQLKRSFDATTLNWMITTGLVVVGGSSFVFGIISRDLRSLSLRALNWIMFLPSVALICLAYRLMEGTSVDEPGIRGLCALLVGFFGMRMLIATGTRMRELLNPSS